ncbi:hypothetical protein GCM10010112_25470 [Actinoplanes lobatus]|uniref:glutaminase n=1 Tax=Actinoplanes lobatus TaxID=113568 RepID=A0A7W7HJB3_9ACTN|nr:glutaminase [Actinoplanes lobatus]MBB4751589.1 hypothetical protein [Actinoplanes lobatus]GGN64858.1 hypothetical protein GCM10010112_25470 [Actinoplanes lobatus]GIE43173.1 hypothetical protein Alo02nite_60710 [Actinoplanes lobatus]
MASDEYVSTAGELPSPRRGSLATFAPPLDNFGNSVRGLLAARFLSRRLGLPLFASEAAA